VRYRYRCRGISVPETPGPQPPAATNREISARERNRSLSGLRQSLLRAERAEQLRRYCGLPMLRLPRQTFRWPTASWQKPRPDGPAQTAASRPNPPQPTARQYSPWLPVPVQAGLGDDPKPARQSNPKERVVVRPNGSSPVPTAAKVTGKGGYANRRIDSWRNRRDVLRLWRESIVSPSCRREGYTQRRNACDGVPAPPARAKQRCLCEAL